MTDKETRTVSLDKDTNEFLGEHDNASALVNDLVEEYRRNGDRGTAGLKLQLKQKQRELSNARDDVTRLETDIEEIETLIAGMQKQENVQLDRAREVLDPESMTVENPAVKNWADKLGLRPEVLLERLQQHD